MEEVEAEEAEVEEVGLEVEAEEEEAPRQEEQPQEEEEIQNSSGLNHLPSAETDKTSTDSYRISWDIYPSIGTTQPWHHSSPGFTFHYPSSQEKKCAIGKTACAHGPTTS